MTLFDNVLQAWIWVALPTLLLSLYLTVNKIWIRRHEAIVAQSVSVAAKFLALFAGLPYFTYYILNGPLEGAVKVLAVMLVDSVLVLIGAGIWVREQRGVGFWKNLSNALRLERKEAATLLRDVFHPVAARHLVTILCNFALIDRDLDDDEQALIQEFAQRWDIDYQSVLDETLAQSSNELSSFKRLRDSVDAYLDLSPPVGQARQLGEVLSLLTQADAKTTYEEDMMLDELLGLIEEYVGDGARTTYLVLIAPQSKRQLELLKDMRPDWSSEQRLGGNVLRIGRYFSRKYAEMICAEYRNNGYLTVTEHEHPLNT